MDTPRAVPLTDGEAMIRLIRRPTRRRDILRAYVVILDGHRAGRLKGSGANEYVVSPGDHTLRLKTDWMGSDRASFHLVAGEVAEFVCEPNGSALSTGRDLYNRRKPWIALSSDREGVTFCGDPNRRAQLLWGIGMVLIGVAAIVAAMLWLPGSGAGP